MPKVPLIAALLLSALALTATASATAAPARRPRPAKPSREKPAMVGLSRDNPFPSPHGLVISGSGGYRVAVDTEDGKGSKPSTVLISIDGPKSRISYSTTVDLAHEGIHASLGLFGRIDLHWKPDGRLRRVRGGCKDHRIDYFFDTGEYVGTIRIDGGNGFTSAVAHGIPWQRRWYGNRYGCGSGISEGFPGPGVLLDAGHKKNFYDPVHLYVIQNEPGAEVSYGVQQFEKVGRIDVTREAEASGRATTLTVGPGFKWGEISPPAPFSGSARFERTEHAKGTWLGDLSVSFPDGLDLPLAGTAFEATMHSGYRDFHEFP